jgi:hypothetical protein
MPPEDRKGARDGSGRGRSAASTLGGRGPSAEPSWKKPAGGTLSAKAKKEYLQWKRSQKREQGDDDNNDSDGADVLVAQQCGGGGSGGVGRRGAKAAVACLDAQQQHVSDAVSVGHGPASLGHSEVRATPAACGVDTNFP